MTNHTKKLSSLEEIENFLEISLNNLSQQIQKQLEEEILSNTKLIFNSLEENINQTHNNLQELLETALIDETKTLTTEEKLELSKSLENILQQIKYNLGKLALKDILNQIKEIATNLQELKIYAPDEISNQILSQLPSNLEIIETYDELKFESDDNINVRTGKFIKKLYWDLIDNWHNFLHWISKKPLKQKEWIRSIEIYNITEYHLNIKLANEMLNYEYQLQLLLNLPLQRFANNWSYWLSITEPLKNHLKQDNIDYKKLSKAIKNWRNVLIKSLNNEYKIWQENVIDLINSIKKSITIKLTDIHKAFSIAGTFQEKKRVHYDMKYVNHLYYSYLKDEYSSLNEILKLNSTPLLLEWNLLQLENNIHNLKTQLKEDLAIRIANIEKKLIILPKKLIQTINQELAKDFDELINILKNEEIASREKYRSLRDLRNTLEQLEERLSNAILARAKKVKKKQNYTKEVFRRLSYSLFLQGRKFREHFISYREDSAELKHRKIPSLYNKWQNFWKNELAKTNYSYRVWWWKFTEQPLIPPFKPPLITRSIAFRKLVNKHIGKKLSKGIKEINEELIKAENKTFSEVESVWNIIHYNLEGAIAELDNLTRLRRKEENISIEKILISEEMALQALERSLTQLDKAKLPLEDEDIKLSSQFIKEAEKNLHTIRQEIITADTWRMHLYHLEKWWEYQKEEYATRRDIFLIHIWKQILSAFHSLAEKRQELDVWLGKTELEVKRLRTTADEVTTSSKVLQLELLPPIYHRLFRFEPLKTSEFLIGRNKEISLIEEAIERWNDGYNSSLAIYGELGIGKTTMLNYIANMLSGEHKILRTTLNRTLLEEKNYFILFNHLFGFKENPPQTHNELIQRINSIDEKKIILLEGLEYLFLRKIGGLDVLRQFLLLMTKTNEKVLWVISSGDIAWQYLEYVLNISRYFIYTLPLSNLKEKALKDTILIRHNVRGYDLHFNLIDEWKDKLKGKLKKANTEEEIQEILHNDFFKQLYTLSRGNIYVAIYHWLRAIDHLEENELIVYPLTPVDFEFIRKFDKNQCFTLAALLQHRDLSLKEHTEIFHTNELHSRMLLDFFTEHNILQSYQNTEDNKSIERYYINTLMVHPIMDLLKDKNIIH